MPKQADDHPWRWLRFGNKRRICKKCGADIKPRAKVSATGHCELCVNAYDRRRVRSKKLLAKKPKKG